MAKVVGDIAINVGADTTSLVKGMRQGEASVSKFAKVGAGAVAALGVAMVALTKRSLSNIDVLAKQARSLGLTTQAFQKMTLVASEAGIEGGKLSAMLGLMQRNLDELRQGTKLQVDAFGRLGLSITDLQGLSPDEQFGKIAQSLDSVIDPAEKTALAMEVFGRSGRESINMLSGYAAAAENAAAFQHRFGIAVAQTTSDGVERANDAVGRLGMAMTGLGNTMAGAVAPALEATANGLVAFVGHIVGARVSLEEFFGTLEKARAYLGEDIVKALDGNSAAIVENEASLDDLIVTYSNLREEIVGAARAINAEVPSLLDLGAAQLALDLADVSDEMRQLGIDLDNGTIKAADFEARLKDATDRAISLVEEASLIDGVDVSGVTARVQALGAALLQAAGNAVELRNNLPGGGTDPASLPVAGGDGSSIGAPFTSDPNAPRTRPTQQGIDSFANFSGSGSGGGGGGGGGGIKDQFARRLEAIVEGLKTEQETIAEWYAMSLEALNQASDAELAAIGGKQEAIERLEKEHQERLSSIREMGNQWGVEAALDGGAEILGAMASTNKRAAKLQGIFAAASALMSTYQGAAKELEKGTFGFASAAAVIAKGIGFVASIKSASSSGQSGTASGGLSGSSAAAPAQAPLQVSLNTFGGNEFVRTDRLGELLSNLNKVAGDRGYTILSPA